MDKYSIQGKKAIDLLKLYGVSPIDYVKVYDPANCVFYLDNPEAIIIYKQYFRSNVLIGNPLCDSGNIEQVLAKFVSMSKAQKRYVTGLQVYENTAQALRKINSRFHINSLGQEASINIADYIIDSLDGQSFAELRRSRNRVRKKIHEGYWTIVDDEQLISHYCNTEALSNEQSRKKIKFEKDEISLLWRKRKENQHELSGIIHDASTENKQEDVKNLYILNLQKSCIDGFCSFSPMYQDGRIFCYYADIQRFRNEKEPHGQYDYLILEGIKRFNAEGVDEVSLGLIPLLYRNEFNDKYSRTVSMMLRILSNELGTNIMFNYLGVAKHKKKFYPERKDIETYIVTYGNLLQVLESLIASLGVVGLLDKGIFEIAKRYVTTKITNGLTKVWKLWR